MSSLMNALSGAREPAPGLMQTSNGHVPGTPYSSMPNAPTAGQGSTNYGSLTNRWRNGVINAGNQAGTGQDNAAGSRNMFMDMLTADPAKELAAYVAGATPDFQKQLQGQREANVARGAGTGDLGTAYEGSIDSAFQRNITAKAGDLLGQQLTAGGQLASLDAQTNDSNQNRYLDALSAQSDQSQQAKNSKNSFLGGIISTVGNVAKAAIH